MGGGGGVFKTSINFFKFFYNGLALCALDCESKRPSSNPG